MYKVCALALTVMCLVASTAHSATVRLDWAGVVDNDAGFPSIGPNEVITGSLVYDTDAPPTAAFQNGIAYGTAVISSSFSVAGFSGRFTGGEIAVVDNLDFFGVPTDEFVSDSRSSDGFTGDTRIDGRQPFGFFLRFSSSNQAALDGTQLPTTLNSSLFALPSQGRLEFFSANRLAFNVTSFQTSVVPAPVPLPAAAWMILSGLGCLGLLRRRKTRLTRPTRVVPA